MRISRLILKNWRNFTDVDVALQKRVFILGNNGLGKSNLLDALRFLRDVAKAEGGGLQYAIKKRGGIANIRSLFARRSPEVKINVEMEEENNGTPTTWNYLLVLKQERSGNHRVLVKEEVIKKNGKSILNRSDDSEGKDDPDKLTQTALEQTSANKDFRDLFHFFQSFHYLHMVPQLIRNAVEFQGNILQDDPYGQGLINNMALLNEKTRKSRLHRISKALEEIKPHFGDFEFQRDARTEHPTYQNEWQLSDGELRLIGLVWTVLEAREVIMLEEPEISFNEGIVNQLPAIFAQAALSRKKGDKPQIIVTTHSAALLSDKGIDGSEVLLLTNTENGGGTKVELVSDNSFMAQELKSGLSVADAVLSHAQTGQLSLL